MPASSTPLTTAAFRDILAGLSEIEQRLCGLDDLDDTTRLESYLWLFSILHVGILGQVWADPARPQFVDIVGPYLKWGGDNADAFYQYVPIDPARTYRVTGHRGDAVYLSITVYGGPSDGHYSERIVGSLNDREFEVAPDGSFELWISPTQQAGPTIILAADAVVGLTRDYLADPATGRRATWQIEATEATPKAPLTDEGLARRLTAAATWLRDQAAIVPIGLGEPNHVDEPYPVPTTTFGWAAGDAAYAMGSFDLGPDEVLLIRGTSPECAFWNLCLWNQFLHTYDYAYDRVTINSAQVEYEPDGSWEIAVASRDPGHPNWVSTQGHAKGRIWFRWFLPAQTPARPTTTVVPNPAA
ncbi:MAG: DUF1214 domain-containing protein [Frankiaceae bacterium]|nr:DUF1214 domain-containing protein [Frankiaceae bacterium]MBV9871885.1 DUF1214 domain-containing protein [Frankiaceae bacterium]